MRRRGFGFEERRSGGRGRSSADAACEAVSDTDETLTVKSCGGGMALSRT